MSDDLKEVISWFERWINNLCRDAEKVYQQTEYLRNQLDVFKRALEHGDVKDFVVQELMKLRDELLQNNPYYSEEDLIIKPKEYNNAITIKGNINLVEQCEEHIKCLKKISSTLRFENYMSKTIDLVDLGKRLKS